MGANIKKDFIGQDILSLDQFDPTSITHLFEATDKLIASLKAGKSLDMLKGSVTTLLFFEPSSRTFGSFSSAIKRLGGQTVEIQDPIHTSSWVKGESFEDTIRVYETYSDAIVIRHPEIGSAKRAADAAKIPVINAGDGGGDHPTQTLLDLFTIYQRFGKLDNLKIVAGRDPLHSRTIKSLAKGLSLYPNNTMYFLSDSALRMNQTLKKELTDRGLRIEEIDHEDEMPNDAHVWYWNRIQKERLGKNVNASDIGKKFIINPELLEKKGGRDLIILDPLPRVEEITPEIDKDPRALYLTVQLRNGLYTRMTLLAMVLGAL